MRRTDLSAPRFVVAVLIVGGALAVAGCSPDPAAVPSPSVPTSTATAPPPGPALDPEGSAADNLPLFAAVVDEVAATDARAQGRAYIDALAAAGFPKSEMEVTDDLTTVGNPVDSIQFSVRWDGECLVGQVGPSTPAPTALVLPLLPGGTCLIGQTRPIDW